MVSFGTSGRLGMAQDWCTPRNGAGIFCLGQIQTIPLPRKSIPYPHAIAIVSLPYLWCMHAPKTTLGSAESLSKLVQRQHILKELENRECTLEEFAAQHGLTRKTLYTLRHKKVESTADLLDSRYFAKGRPARRDDRAISWALAYKESHPKAHLKQVHLQLVEAFKDKEIPIPSYGQLKHSFRKDHKQLIDMIERGGKSWFHESAMTVRRETARLNTEWQLDATMMDTWSLSMQSMKLYRPWLLSVIDSASRVVLAADVLDREPNAKDGLLLLRRAILPKNSPDAPYFGKVLSIVPDNHQMWKAVTFVESMLKAGIHIVPVPNDAPQAKGKQERWFRTIKEQLCANLIGYTNQSGGLAKAEQRAIPGPLMQGLVNNYLSRYHSSFHSSIGTSPWERWHALLDTAEGLLFDVKLINDSFKVVETAEVQRDGIRTSTGHHLNAAFLAHLVGQEVTLKLPLDGFAEGVEAFYKGAPIPELFIIEGNEELAAEVASARLNQSKALKGIRKTLRKALKLAPPIKTDAVEVESQREAGKASSKKKTGPESSNQDVPELPTEAE